MSVVIETTLGDFTVDLFVVERPYACKNFLKLCKIKYYNLCLFHSVQHNFIAQTGDPTGTGKNGESVFGIIHGAEKRYFEAEMMPKIKHTTSGLISMVNYGNNMLGSQFFLTLANDLQSLDSEHCVFGEIVEGHEILLKLNEVICDTEHRPYQDIRITHTVVLEDSFEDPPGLQVPDQSPEPTKENLLNSRIAPDEDLDETKGLTAKELEEIVRDREAQAQATILEIVGDLPDADMAPPENVLFVCKLNPVTTDDDLEIIFCRFGKVKGCEVIRDKVTGDSLQYAFVEFEVQKSCEDAFFKMDNVLIDDRRIHVDFSQSVSKLRWKGKGRGVEHLDDSSLQKDTGKERSRNEGKHKESRDNQTKSRGSKILDDDSWARKFREDSHRRDNRVNEDMSSYRKDNKKQYGHRKDKIYEQAGERTRHSERSYSREKRNERERQENYSRTRSNRDIEREHTKERYEDKSREYARSEERMEHSSGRHQDHKSYIKGDKMYNQRSREETSERRQDYKRDSRQSNPKRDFEQVHARDRGGDVSRNRHSEDNSDAVVRRSRDDGKSKTSNSRSEDKKEVSQTRIEKYQSVDEKGRTKMKEKGSRKKSVRSSSSSSSSSDSSTSSDSSSSDLPIKKKKRKQKAKGVRKEKKVEHTNKERLKRKLHGKKKLKRKASSSDESTSSSSSSTEKTRKVKKSKSKRDKK